MPKKEKKRDTDDPIDPVGIDYFGYVYFLSLSSYLLMTVCGLKMAWLKTNDGHLNIASSRNYALAL